MERISTRTRRRELTLILPATLAHPALAQFGGWGGGGWNGGSSSSGSGYSGYGGSSDGDGDGDGDSFGFGFGAGVDYDTAMRRRTAHGIVATVAFVILFPLGAILLRLIPGRFSVWIHALVQVLAWLLYIAGFALGVVLLRMLPSGGQSLVSAYPRKKLLCFGYGFDGVGRLAVLGGSQADTAR